MQFWLKKIVLQYKLGQIKTSLSMCDKKELILKMGRIPFTSYFCLIKYQLLLLDVQIRKKID